MRWRENMEHRSMAIVVIAVLVSQVACDRGTTQRLRGSAELRTGGSRLTTNDATQVGDDECDGLSPGDPCGSPGCWYEGTGSCQPVPGEDGGAKLACVGKTLPRGTACDYSEEETGVCLDGTCIV